MYQKRDLEKIIWDLWFLVKFKVILTSEGISFIEKKPFENKKNLHELERKNVKLIKSFRILYQTQ